MVMSLLFEKVEKVHVKVFSLKKWLFEKKSFYKCD